MFELIAFDADDTLWHNERHYRHAAARLQTLLAHTHDAATVERALYETEMRNMAGYGYGLKTFTLSMIETAVSLNNGQPPGHIIRALLDGAKEMIAAEVELLPGARKTLAALAPHYPLIVITKGDILDQERKLARSGLADLLADFVVVSHKNAQVYGDLLRRRGVAPQRFMMVGNSLRSDVLPVVEIGATAVYVPHHLTWEHEADVEPHAHANGYHELARLDELPALLARLHHNHNGQGRKRGQA